MNPWKKTPEEKREAVERAKRWSVPKRGKNKYGPVRESGLKRPDKPKSGPLHGVKQVVSGGLPTLGKRR
jgi:hypothetical protein